MFRWAHSRDLVLCGTLVATAVAAGLTATDVSRSMSARGLDYPESDRLVTLVAASKSWSPAMFEVASANGLFDLLAGVQERGVTVQFASLAEVVRLESVSSTYFELLGLTPARGRLFTKEEDRRNGATPVAVISDRFWRRRFDASPSVIGQTVIVDGRHLEIIGVLPSGSAGLIGRTDLWTPLGSARWLSGDTGPERPSSRWFEVFGRLRRGLDPASASRRLLAELPAAMSAAGLPADLVGSPPRVSVTPLTDARMPPIGRKASPILRWTAAALYLFVLITVSSILLLRSRRRAHDVRVQMALGASLPHLLRPPLADAVLITGIGAGLALILRPVFTGMLASMRPPSTSFGIVTAEWLRASPAFDIASVLVIAVTFVVLTAVSVLTRLTTVRRARRHSMWATGPVEGLSRLATSGVWLVSAQVALACVVLAGALLMRTAVGRVIGADRGYVPTNVWTARITLPGDTGVNDTSSFLARLHDRLSSTPGIDDVSFATCAPGAGRCRQSNISNVDGAALDRHRAPQIGVQTISAGFLRTIGASVTRGRGLEISDAAGAANVVVVTEALATRLWPGVDPIGHQLEVYTANGSLAGLRTVVGTVRSIQFNVDDDAGLDVFLPVSQVPASSLMVFIKGKSSARALLDSLQREVSVLDPSVPVYDFAPLVGRLSESLATERLIERGFLSFGGVALMLALVGVYAVTSTSVLECARELAVRKAIGASDLNIRLLVARRAIVIALVGSGVGTAMALLGGRTLGALLHGLPTNHQVLYLAPLVTIAIVGLAIIWPIRKASRVSVLIAMRQE